MMEFLDYFSSSYQESQDKFLEAVKASGATLESHHHPLPGPNGEKLSMHVARIGAPDAIKMLVLSAGTHGAEGLCGSACLIGWLREERYKTLPKDTAALLIHFVNPYGVAWRCRQTEDNVDLNRNFIDHAAGQYPKNPAYDALHDALLSAPANAAERAAKDKILAAYALKHGRAAFNAAILTGQFNHPDGLFYGGSSPVWSHVTILDVMRRHCGSATQVAQIDYHTGLGPYGYAILVNADMPGSIALKRTFEWYGETVCAVRQRAADGTTESDGPSAVGDMCSGIRAVLPQALYIYVAIEYGTYDINRLIDVYRDDCSLRKFGSNDAHYSEKIRMNFQNFFYPDFADWKEMVWSRSEQVTRQAAMGLGGTAYKSSYHSE